MLENAPLYHQLADQIQELLALVEKEQGSGGSPGGESAQGTAGA